MRAMDGEIAGLTLTAALGAGLLVLGLLAAIGPVRTLKALRGAGLAGALLALFVGTVVQSLARPLVDAPPYTLAFLPTTVLRVQGLAEDPDVRTRYNVDPRLRYLPSRGETVVDLEGSYVPDLDGLRRVEVRPVVHASRAAKPAGVVAMDEAEFGREVDGLYEKAWATLERSERTGAYPVGRVEFLGAASVGLLVLGMVGLLAGLVPLLFRLLGAAWDGLRLLRLTASPSYRGVRRRAWRYGFRELMRWHAGEARSFATLATFGLLLGLGGVVLGLLRESKERSLARDVFREAREIRIEAKR